MLYGENVMAYIPSDKGDKHYFSYFSTKKEVLDDAQPQRSQRGPRFEIVIGFAVISRTFSTLQSSIKF